MKQNINIFDDFGEFPSKKQRLNKKIKTKRISFSELNYDEPSSTVSYKKYRNVNQKY